MAGETTSEEVFEGLVERYLSNLGPTKRGKALIDNELFAFILDTLRDPSDTTLGDSGERYWARAHFELIRPADDQHGEVLGPKGDPLVRYFTINQKTRKRTAEKSVAQRHEIYEIVKEAHERTKHGGRDKTYSAVKAEWSHIPKELVTGFIKECPSCCSARKQQRMKRDQHHRQQTPPPPRLPTPPPASKVSSSTMTRQGLIRPRVDECYDLPPPPRMFIPSVAPFAFPQPPMSTTSSQWQFSDMTETYQDVLSQLPTPPISFDPPRQSPFRPLSIFDPSIKSPASLFAGPAPLYPTRSPSLTPSFTSSSSTAPPTPSTACASGDGAEDFDPSYWLSSSLFDEQPVLTCSPSMLLSNFSTPVPQPHFSFAPTTFVHPQGLKRLASPFDDSDCLPADCPLKRGIDEADYTPPPSKRRRVVRARP
ncbi:immunoglobulin-like domain contaning protein [Rhodotorula toruloides]|uniref:Immunoglobulin-like domain contaning protein n=1 Tax=Rhodotorula toruloides TaxID=5286 RepID=A0A511KME0_RHOTO|nr:immunoglobulin-like domain contaning protein [Rhodotorula toruloides]